MAQSFSGEELLYHRPKTELENLGDDAKRLGLKVGWAKPISDNWLKDPTDLEEMWIICGGTCTFEEFRDLYNRALLIYRGIK